MTQPTKPTQRFRVGADIGGTFTDLIIVNQETGEFEIGKVLTLSLIHI